MTQQLQGATEQRYKVVWPLGKFVSPPIDPAPALLDLNGKTIGEIWDGVFRGDQIYSIINRELRKQFPSIKIVDHKAMGGSHGVGAKEHLDNLSNLLRQYGCDAVVSAVGA